MQRVLWACNPYMWYLVNLPFVLFSYEIQDSGKSRLRDFSDDAPKVIMLRVAKRTYYPFFFSFQINYDAGSHSHTYDRIKGA